MKAIKVMVTVNEQGQLALNFPLTVEKPSRAEVIILIPEGAETEENPTKEEILNDFLISWQEAKNGDTTSVAQLWKD